MSLSKQIAKHVRDIYFGYNWTTSNLKKKLQKFKQFVLLNKGICDHCINQKTIKISDL